MNWKERTRTNTQKHLFWNEMMESARDLENDTLGMRLETIGHILPEKMDLVPALNQSKTLQNDPMEEPLLQTRKRPFNHDTNPRLPLLLQNSNVPSPPKKLACLNPLFRNSIGESTVSHNLSPHKSVTPLLAPTQDEGKEEAIGGSGIKLLQLQPAKGEAGPPHTQSHPHSLHNSHHANAGGHAQNKNLGRLAGDELTTWQNSWKKIMKESTVYFEGVSEYNHLQMSEFRRASRHFKLVGCAIAPFFDNDVTIIVSRRQYSGSREYPSSDIFSNVNHLKIKVWDYSKVFRFLKNLGINTDVKLTNITQATLNEKAVEESTKEDDKHLYNLLREEKIYGTNDRDLNAKRDDLHYLERNYLYVYDLSQNARPIAIREWDEGTFPVLNLTMDGKCPFISEPSDTNGERKKLRRLQKFSATQSYRSLLKRVTHDMVRRIRNNNSVSPALTVGPSKKDLTPPASAPVSIGGECDETIAQSTSSLLKLETGDKIQKQEIAEQSADSRPAIPSATNSFKEPITLAALNRNSSCINPLNPHTNTNAGETMASGYNGASNAVNFSMDASLNSAAAQGNGLGPLVSQVPSRNLTHLKRRIIIKKQQQSAGTIDTRRMGKDLVPGYCENCRVKYDHFEEHIRSNRHRNFACNDENFKDIDKLITLIGESKALGHITSNGDFRYSF